MYFNCQASWEKFQLLSRYFFGLYPADKDCVLDLLIENKSEQILEPVGFEPDQNDG